MTIHEAIVTRIKQLMKKNNVNQSTLSKITGIPKSTINDLLNYRTKTTSSLYIVKISKAFGIKISEFFNNDIFNNLAPPKFNNKK